MVPPGDLHGEIADTGAAAEAPGDASSYWAKHLPLLQAGVDGWWPDEGDRLSVYARAQRNKLYWEGGREAEPNKRPFALHRNGYAGLQRYGWLWSGDTFSTWAALKAQIMVGINIGLCGIPWWGTDTGGFVPTPEYTPELYVRWFQFSAFCPSFRSHGRAWKLHLPWGWNLGTAEPKEMDAPWVASWPPDADLHRADVEPICRKFLELRYRLLPYLYSSASETHDTGMPMIRALWLGYSHDAKTWLIDDAYLWGDCFLVAPICAKDATSRTVYLPEGEWWDFWSMERLAGKREITAHAALESMPLYVRAGSIVPMGPVKQYTSETSSQPPILRIYPGADGHFRWYHDDGATFDYEHGAFMRVACAWDDRRRTLTLTRDAGGSMHTTCTVHVELAGSSETRTATLIEEAVRVQFQEALP
jgi:alpha-glucosidase/alpha-D-xyloside xylohydrolase